MPHKSKLLQKQDYVGLTVYMFFYTMATACTVVLLQHEKWKKSYTKLSLGNAKYTMIYSCKYKKKNLLISHG